MEGRIVVFFKTSTKLLSIYYTSGLVNASVCFKKIPDGKTEKFNL